MSKLCVYIYMQCFHNATALAVNSDRLLSRICSGSLPKFRQLVSGTESAYSQISRWKSTHNFLSYSANKQTNAGQSITSVNVWRR